jgi:hypothetical protein
LVVGIKQLENGVSAVGRIGGKALDGFLQPNLFPLLIGLFYVIY